MEDLVAIPPLNGGIATHIYYERYVNEGTRDYSKVSEINEFDACYRPTSDIPFVRVARFSVPAHLLDVYVSSPSKSVLKSTSDEENIIMFVHPQCLDDPTIPFMDLLSKCKRMEDIVTVPTSSTRTLICKEDGDWAVKTSCPKRISKYRRNISNRMVAHAIAVSSMLESVSLSGFAFLQESKGVAFKQDSTPGSPKAWGYICRNYIPYPMSPISGTTLIPCFALYGGYKYHPTQPKLFSELLHRERINTGRDISAREFILNRILYVAINTWIHIFTKHGIILDEHGQNLMMELSPTGEILRLVYRDIDVPISLVIRKKNGLVSNGYHPDCVIDHISPERPHGCYVSLSYDRFMGECFFDFIERLLVEEHKLTPGLLAYDCRTFFEAKFPNFYEYFPHKVHVYSSEEISPNFYAIIPTTRTPKWRPEIPTSLIIVDTTLREGLQSKLCNFTLANYKSILKGLNKFGVQYAELPNPRISTQMPSDIMALISYRNQYNMRIKLLAHVRLVEEDITAALLCSGLDGLNITISTSKNLSTNSHRLSIVQICDRAKSLLQIIDRKNLIIRFSGEDSFRSETKDLAFLMQELSPLVDRFSIPDTLGIASSSQIRNLMQISMKAAHEKNVIHPSFECHFHNDSGCANANAFEAWVCGVKYINTTVLGIGERNGITGMADFIARMYTYDKGTLKEFNLPKLVSLYNLVSGLLGIEISPGTPIVGELCFYHKAGIHTSAMLRDSHTYQAIDPHDFGLETTICKFSSLTGWNTVKATLNELGIELSDEKIKLLTQAIKDMK